MSVRATKPAAKIKKVEDELRKYCLALPEAHEDHPWEHLAFKVHKKVFVFMGTDHTGLGVSVKLTKSHGKALKFPWASPTHYGLGKHGWVSAEFGPKDKIPLDLIKSWIEESFRAVAPKKIIKQWDEGQIKPAPANRSSALEEEILEKLRLVCLDLPETSEFKAWGHPNFKAGSKTFAVLEIYKGILSIAMKVGAEKKRRLLEDSRFYETPYVGKQGWASLKIDSTTVKNWSEVRDLIVESYKNAASSKMLKQID